MTLYNVWLANTISAEGRETFEYGY